MSYAFYLSKKGVGSASKVIKWSESALANKQQWQGAEYKKNVNALYGMRAQAAVQLWQNADKKLIEDNSEVNKQKAEKVSRSGQKLFEGVVGLRQGVWTGYQVSDVIVCVCDSGRCGVL